jgi:hypothetical protein
MRVGRVYGFGTQRFEAIAVKKHIDAAQFAAHAAAFHEYRSRPQLQNLLGGLLHIFERGNF